MEKSSKIVRETIHIFLKNYHYFTITPSLIALPFSISLLLAQTFLSSSSPSPLLPIYNRLRALFEASGFPSSQFFNILNYKLSQTVSTSILTLPFTLTFFLITKSSIIQSLKNRKDPTFSASYFFSILSLYYRLLLTYFYNSLLIISGNATIFTLLFFAFNFFDEFTGSYNYSLFMSGTLVIVYSTVIAHSFVICNLALVLSGMENDGGYMAILKACILIRGRTSTALSLAIPVNLAMAGVEALFQYRVVRAYFLCEEEVGFSMVFEGILIGYLYSVLIVLDTIMNCLFFKRCRIDFQMDLEGRNRKSWDLMDFEGEEETPLIKC